MATAATTPSPNPTQKRNVPRRRRLIGRRRRVGEADGTDEEVQSATDLANDNSLTEGSIASDEREPANDSDTSNIDEASPTMAVPGKVPVSTADSGQADGRGNRTTAGSGSRTPAEGANGPSDPPRKPPATNTSTPSQAHASVPAPKTAQPAIVSSSAAPTPRRETAYDRQRREHDLYRQRRDEDPSFVPNRGAFFMHDHRGAGPAANGFRPFSRPGRGGRGRGGYGGAYSPMHGQFHNQADPTANQPWAHDMHDVVAQPHAPRLPIPRRQNFDAVSQYTASQYAGSQYAGSQYAGSHYAGSQYGGSQFGGTRSVPPAVAIPTCPPSSIPINRSMSVEKPLGTLTVRVFFPPMKEPIFFEKFKVMQYTKLPDHRPPLRRDKAVVVDLPGHPKRQIFPAVDRSFIFIPRALRPNQQRARGGRTRSVMGSISGFSRRTSIFGGSYYNGSVYSPSTALSRRSSIAQDVGRDFIISPAGSVISRPPIAMENTARPVVRLPPSAGPPVLAPGVIPGLPVVEGQVPTMHMPVAVPPMEPARVSMPAFPQRQPAQGAPQTSSRPAQPPLPPQPPQPPQQAQASQPLSQTSSQPSQSGQPPETSSLSTVPPPQHHPLPQKPTFQENRPSHNLPMHQPRPQKTVSVENIETPAAIGSAQPPTSQPYAMAFHQQVPIPIATGFPPVESHSRHPSYQSHTTGTPLSQIPERAIHAAPFQPNMPSQQQMGYTQQNTMGGHPGPTYYGGAPPGYILQSTPQQGYFYPTPPSYPSTIVSPAGVPAFVPGGPPQSAGPVYGQAAQVDVNGAAGSGQHNMVAQEVNGMVYYVDASQLPSMPAYAGYNQGSMPQGGYMPGVGGMVTPAPAEGYYYGGQPSMVYYQQ